MTQTKPDLGKLPELAWLPVDKLEVDHTYQRTLTSTGSKKLIAKIVAEFRWARFQAILATPKGDRWLIIDGQHRADAARQLGIRHLPAVVLGGLTLADQADSFVGANRDRVAVSAQAIFHARVAAGDQEAVAIERLCHTAGVEIMRYPMATSQIAAGKTAAVPMLLRLYRQYGEDITASAVAIVAAVFGRAGGGLRAPFFAAVARCLKVGSTPAQLTERLRTVGIMGLEQVSVGQGGYVAVGEMAALLRQGAMTRPVAVPPGVKPISPPRAAAPPPRPKPRVTLSTSPAKPPQPTADQRRREEEKQIRKHLADKGARLVMGPERVATFLRDAGHHVVIAEVNENKTGHRGLKLGYRPVLDQRPCTLEELYQAANQLRAEEGLPLIDVPGQSVAA